MAKKPLDYLDVVAVKKSIELPGRTGGLSSNDVVAVEQPLRQVSI